MKTEILYEGYLFEAEQYLKMEDDDDMDDDESDEDDEDWEDEEE